MDTWRQVFELVILLAVGLLGSPITQAIKNGLGKLFNITIEERLALALTGVIAAILAVVEMLLSGALNLKEITPGTFPGTFTAVFTVATFYYGLLKNSDSFLGKGALLRKLK